MAIIDHGVDPEGKAVVRFATIQSCIDEAVANAPSRMVRTIEVKKW
jgi:hypothetical protein